MRLKNAAMFLTLLIIGCASNERAIQQQRQEDYRYQQQQQEMQRQGRIRQEKMLANIKENWGKLKEGMSLEEVATLIGPFYGSKEMEENNMDFFKGSMSEAAKSGSKMQQTLDNGIVKLIFEDGKLKNWSLIRH